MSLGGEVALESSPEAGISTPGASPTPGASKIARLLDLLAHARWHWGGSAAVLALGGIALWFHFAQRYFPFFSDDGFISLRYTQRLLEGQGLTWTDGERVEGYSNLLWVLACALPGALGFDLVAGARFLGWASTVSAMGALLFTVRPGRLLEVLPALVAVGLLVLSGSTVVWALGGLEGPLVWALLAWGIVLTVRALEEGARRHALWAAGCMGLLCWTRPDGALWGVSIALGALLGYRRRAVPLSVALVSAVALCVGAQLALRLVYYGDYLPNTAYAKVAFEDERLSQGIVYLQDSFAPLAATWCSLSLGLLGTLVTKSTRPRGLLLLVVLGLWVAYVVRVGGDFFPAWRHWSYLVVLAAIVICWIPPGAHAVRRSGPNATRLGGMTPAAYARFGVTLLVLAFVGTYYDPRNWAARERWEWDGKIVGLMLKQGFSEKRPLLAVDAAGALPFFWELPTLDMLGLTDRYLAHHRPETFGKLGLGHELGDADYYWERRPDILCFGPPPCWFEPKYPAQRAFFHKREFRTSYVPARFVSHAGRRELVSEIWLAKEGKVGVRVEADRVVVPGYLLMARTPGVTARLEPSGQFVTSWEPNQKTQLEGISLGAGRWRLTAQGPVGDATLRVRQGRRELATGAADRPLELSLQGEAEVGLRIEAGQSGFQVRELWFERS